MAVLEFFFQEQVFCSIIFTELIWVNTVSWPNGVDSLAGIYT